MTVTASVSIDRSSLSLSDLVIAGDGATYQLTIDGLGEPGITWRLTAAPDSVNVHGSEYVGAVKEQTSLPLEVIVKAANSAALATAIDALTDALSQFSYDATVTIDGVARVWSCSPAAWSVASVRSSIVEQFFRVLTITIPVYPIPGSA